VATLESWLEAEELLPARERRKAQRLYEALRLEVYAGAMDAVRRHQRRFERRRHAVATACTPAADWEKGQVENQVGNVREWLFTPKVRFADLAELNAHLAARCLELAAEPRHPEQTERTISEVWAEERAALRALPAHFDGFAEKSCRISATCLVYFERNRYSVESRTVGQVATVRAYAERIVVVCANEVIAEHPRCFERGRTLYNPWHYIAALGRKPGALRNGAPFKDWNLPGAMTRLREHLAKHPDGDRQFVEILSMVSLYGLEAVSEACAAALDDQVVSSAHVVNLLRRAAEPRRVAVLQVPEALTLRIEPAANCVRYDQLLRSRSVISVFMNPHPSEDTDAIASTGTTEDAALERHGQCAGRELECLEPEETGAHELAGAAAAGGTGRPAGTLLPVPAAPGALADAARSG
jgi:hypothetical protein